MNVLVKGSTRTSKPIKKNVVFLGTSGKDVKRLSLILTRRPLLLKISSRNSLGWTFIYFIQFGEKYSPA